MLINDMTDREKEIVKQALGMKGDGYACARCRGFGKLPISDGWWTCPDCKGSGKSRPSKPYVIIGKKKHRKYGKVLGIWN